MFAGFVDGKRGGRERRVGERSHGHRDHVGKVVARVVHGCAAGWAEAMGELSSFVACAGPFGRSANDADLCFRPACLGTEDASGALLTGKAVTHGNPDGLALTTNRQFAATTRRQSRNHARLVAPRVPLRVGL